jgi:hypothetical protein
MVEERFRPYRNPLGRSELPHTGHLKADFAFDLAEFWQDLWSATLKTAFVFIVAMTVLDLHYDTSMEVALLLGVADFCTKQRRLRVLEDLRERVDILAPKHLSTPVPDEGSNK